ncbi:MAG: hypothetical protein IME96_07330 [Proteobacteria bacterium]|nr:hypothetical protein [Pseudomonadota bacterium]
MRRILKEAFDREGIEIPFPGRVIIFDNGERMKLQNALVRLNLKRVKSFPALC